MIGRFVQLASIAVLLCGGAVAAKAQDQQPAPDNSKVNKRDRAQQEPTADQQKMNPADRETTRKIRAAVMHDKSLSMYAHNIKIITQNGEVTLKGPVRSEEEKNAIEEKAATVAGKEHVNNQIEVKPEKQ